MSDREAFIPLITPECMLVVAEGGNDTEYFNSRIDVLAEQQPHLFQKLIDSANAITLGVVDDCESDEYKYIFTNLLAIAVQTYMSVDKQIGIDFLEKTIG